LKEVKEVYINKEVNEQNVLPFFLPSKLNMQFGILVTKRRIERNELCSAFLLETDRRCPRKYIEKK